MKFYPVFANIRNKPVVVIGGGQVAYRKIQDLLEAGAFVKIISPEIHEKITRLQQDNKDSIEIVYREYKYGDIDKAYLVIAATDTPEVNRTVFKEAEEKCKFFNSVDDPPNCSFIVPSMFRKGDLTFALSTSGASPAMAAKLRRICEQNIPENIDIILEALREARITLNDFEQLDSPARGRILKRIVNDDSLLKKLLEQKNKGLLKDLLKTLV
ncbi:MAG: bifunctional precorrin-2 dehydrogenase/sirohydrochlorin ferrochelatase [Spirochaetes bacterium]|nr:bifunctional precorrin-2 dehydrogenase/sirohydrochlorin ferrochelatase [Spirochaetota bacterium]